MGKRKGQGKSRMQVTCPITGKIVTFSHDQWRAMKWYTSKTQEIEQSKEEQTLAVNELTEKLVHKITYQGVTYSFKVGTNNRLKVPSNMPEELKSICRDFSDALCERAALVSQGVKQVSETHDQKFQDEIKRARQRTEQAVQNEERKRNVF